MTPTEIIEKLGGTAEVARLCQVQMPSVSEWKSNGIPKARLMFLRAIRPDVFAFELANPSTNTAEQGA